MNDFYQKFNIPNLSDIQKEVLDYFKKHNHLIQEDAEDEYFVQFNIKDLPILNNFLKTRALSEIVETSTCFLPGYKNLRIHIDGLKKDNGKVPKDRMIANRNVLIIPINHTENSINYWYRNEDVSDEDEEIVNRIRPVAPYNFFVSFCTKELNPIASTVIDKPTFIKSDIYHNTHNNGPETRLVFIVRFHEEEHFTLDDIFQYTDLL